MSDVLKVLPNMPDSTPLVEWWGNAAWHPSKDWNTAPELAPLAAFVAEVKEKCPQGTEHRFTLNHCLYRAVWSIDGNFSFKFPAEPPVYNNLVEMILREGGTAFPVVGSDQVTLRAHGADEGTQPAKGAKDDNEDVQDALRRVLQIQNETARDIARNRLRDDFAKAAITGIVTGTLIDSGNQARLAYRLADAMMRERDETRKPPKPVKPQIRSYGSTNLWLDLADWSGYPEVAKMLAARVVEVVFRSGANEFRITEISED